MLRGIQVPLTKFVRFGVAQISNRFPICATSLRGFGGSMREAFIGRNLSLRQRFFISFEGFCPSTSHERIKAPMKAKFFITLSAVLLPIAFGPRSVSAAEPLILIVATNGTPSPDGIGRIANFPSAGAARGPSLNDAGQAAFRASLTGTGVGPTNDSGIFRGSTGNLSLL